MHNNHLWLLDSGYNNHMTIKKIIFSSLDNSFTTKVKLGDDYLVNLQANERVSSKVKITFQITLYMMSQT